MDEETIDALIENYRKGYWYGATGTEEQRIIAQRIHELQQLKRPIKSPESFLQPKKDFTKGAPKPWHPQSLKSQLLMLIEEQTQ